jgi:hypothetical protein
MNAPSRTRNEQTGKKKAMLASQTTTERRM